MPLEGSNAASGARCRGRRSASESGSRPTKRSRPIGADVFVRPGAALTIADPLTIDAGAAIVKQGAGFLSITSTVIGNDAGALLVLGGRVSIGATMSVDSLTIGEHGAVDLGTTLLVVKSFDAATIRSALHRGATSDGSSGLFSSGADERHALAYAATDSGGEIALSLVGDATRDGAVTFDDLLILARHFGATDRVWSEGDFTCDGVVDANDLNAARGNYADSNHTGAFDSDWELARSLAPEPAGLAVFASSPLLRRRRV